MKNNKITLNEELSRMRFLINTRSGKLMTISDINKTYLSEQETSAGARSVLTNGNKTYTYPFNPAVPAGIEIQSGASNSATPFQIVNEFPSFNNDGDNIGNVEKNRGIFIKVIDQGSKLRNWIDTVLRLSLQTIDNVKQNGQPLNTSCWDAVLNRFKLAIKPLSDTLKIQELDQEHIDSFMSNDYQNFTVNRNNINTLLNTIKTVKTNITQFEERLKNGFDLNGETNDPKQAIPITGFQKHQGFNDFLNDMIGVNVQVSSASNVSSVPIALKNNILTTLLNSIRTTIRATNAGDNNVVIPKLQSVITANQNLSSLYNQIQNQSDKQQFDLSIDSYHITVYTTFPSGFTTSGQNSSITITK